MHALGLGCCRQLAPVRHSRASEGLSHAPMMHHHAPLPLQGHVGSPASSAATVGSGGTAGPACPCADVPPNADYSCAQQVARLASMLCSSHAQHASACFDQAAARRRLCGTTCSCGSSRRHICSPRKLFHRSHPSAGLLGQVQRGMDGCLLRPVLQPLQVRQRAERHQHRRTAGQCCCRGAPSRACCRPHLPAAAAAAAVPAAGRHRCRPSWLTVS